LTGGSLTASASTTDNDGNNPPFSNALGDEDGDYAVEQLSLNTNFPDDWNLDNTINMEELDDEEIERMALEGMEKLGYARQETPEHTWGC
jgi:hypothetical protein